MKILTIIGARPQFIKAAIVSRALHSNKISEIIVHTGQHFDSNMSDIFFDELDMFHPKYNLDIGGGTHGQNTGRMIEAIEEVLINEQPDWVLVYGDTDSTLAGTLAAVKLHIPIAHVEAGLRSFNRQMPEEHNRVLTDHAVTLLFAPTTVAVEHLTNEGIKGSMVQFVGDVMYDAALFYGDKADQKSKILEQLKLIPKTYILATVHRAENTDNPSRLAAIIDGFGLSKQTIILPLHPRTKSKLELLGIKLPSNIKLIEPVGYIDMVMLEKNARLIATDSGGVQKEAFFYHVPCVTLRDETEWVELVESGWNRLASPDTGAAAIADLINKALDSTGENIKPYGDGDSASRIAKILLSSNIQ